MSRAPAPMKAMAPELCVSAFVLLKMSAVVLPPVPVSTLSRVTPGFTANVEPVIAKAALLLSKVSGVAVAPVTLRPVRVTLPPVVVRNAAAAGIRNRPCLR